MKLRKEVFGNVTVVLSLIIMQLFQLVRFVYPEPLTIENIFSRANIKETLLAIFLAGIILGPIYYLLLLKPKYGEQKEESRKDIYEP